MEDIKSLRKELQNIKQTIENMRSNVWECKRHLRNDTALLNHFKDKLTNTFYKVKFIETFPIVYEKAKHAFVKGCSKETMSYWWRDITGVAFPPNLLRKLLIQLVYNGKLYRTCNQDGYTCFNQYEE
jgi:hypothetical protein